MVDGLCLEPSVAEAQLVELRLEEVKGVRKQLDLQVMCNTFKSELEFEMDSRKPTCRKRWPATFGRISTTVPVVVTLTSASSSVSVRYRPR